MLSAADKTVLDDVVHRWKSNKQGMLLRTVSFVEAVPTLCHDNAARYVERHGGTVMPGWLVEYPEDRTAVIVYSHSVVKLDSGELVDPTLPAEKLRTLSFIEHDDALAVFDDIKVRLAQRTVRIVRHGDEGARNAIDIAMRDVADQ